MHGCDDIEKMGTEIKRMKVAAAEVHCPAVKIETEWFFTIPFTRNPEYVPAARVPGQDARLLGVCIEEKCKAERMAQLGLKGRDNFEKMYLRPALEPGLLALTFPDKPTIRMQHYQLTKKCKQSRSEHGFAD